MRRLVVSHQQAKELERMVRKALADDRVVFEVEKHVMIVASGLGTSRDD